MSTHLTYMNELQNLHAESVRRWEESHKADVPNTLYHYTNAQGLIGILKERSIWASNVCFLNDSKELVHGKNQIIEVLCGALKNYSSGLANEFLSTSLDRVSKGHLELDVYAACFCTDGDLLSQWRAYGSMGEGYCLGLCAKSIEQISPSWSPSFKFKLRKVFYDISEQQEMIQESIYSICGLLERACQDENLSEQECSQFVVDAGQQLDAELREFLYCFKHPAFREEQEWRIVHTCPSGAYNTDLQFRSSKGKIVPYLPLPLVEQTSEDEARIPLVNIKFGSILTPETTEKSLRHLLKFHKYANMETQISVIPFLA